MIKEKQIRTLIPFAIVLASTFFLSGAELFEGFGARKFGDRLMALMLSGDGLQGAASFGISFVMFRAWYLNRFKQLWFNDLMWQLSGAFGCWFIASVFSMLGFWWQYLWLSGMFRLFSGIFLVYVCNTVMAARHKLYHPETPEEAKIKAQKLDEVLKLLKDD